MLGESHDGHDFCHARGVTLAMMMEGEVGGNDGGGEVEGSGGSDRRRRCR